MTAILSIISNFFDFVQTMLCPSQYTIGVLGLVAEVQRVNDGGWPGPGNNFFPYE